MELTAWSEGLGTSMVGVNPAEQEQVKTLLGIPEDLQLITVMPFGYPTEQAKAGGKRRKPVSEIAHAERFGQQYVSG